MAVFASTAPPMADFVMASPVAHLLSSGPQGIAGRGGAVDLTPSHPMALFTLGVSDIATETAFASVKSNGWRYILSDRNQDPVAVADLHAAAPGKPVQFNSLIRGKLASRLNDAAILADQLYGQQQARYEARVLEIPALYRTALWLHGARDIFFPVLEGSARDDEPVREQDDFLDRLRAEARRQPTAAAAQPTPRAAAIRRR